ncbi:ABC transporter substrate-binding protein [Microbacterium sp. W4I20]|uniref:ABC transporter substrate-binding protein n=1 Tax=Microbacterium sp. W4I20 TaxID=3042262 RepID=UPI002787823B|nr:sugar ABC transporter substrate-binding protein [Microbacterium sp. W4I20]MDQ0727372.1 ABC-type glycerol-3-phosphate transport system substrate-binding protein [Microbacterium sp. W4I20]
MNKAKTLAAVGVVSLLALTACSPGSSDEASGGDVTLNYWLWDDTQLPLYQECADDFHAANPEITVKITQTGWAQYWQNLSTQITAGTAPDVFTNQISYYLQFVKNNQLLDLTDYVEKSDIDFSQYKEGLADRWVTDEKRFGLPKDWDTVALLYNVEAATEAGYTAEDLSDLTWNPDDGGTFTEFVKATTLDSAGRNGLDPAFDKDDVVRYGYYPEWADGAVGQNGWGNFAHSNGFTFSDEKGAGATTFNYDSKPLVETAAWLQSLIEDGYAPKFEAQSTLGTQAVMENQNVTSTITGSWMASTYLAEDAPVEFAFAMVPEGPDGPHGSDERPGRLGLGRHQAPRRGRSLGRVPRVRGLPGQGRRRRPDLPGAELGNGCCARGARRRGLRLLRVRQRRGRRRDVPHPGLRALRGGQHHHPGRHAGDRAGRRPEVDSERGQQGRGVPLPVRTRHSPPARALTSRRRRVLRPHRTISSHRPVTRRSFNGGSGGQPLPPSTEENHVA